ncbi:MAG: TolC family outer membrane protein [Magnetococcales bacterium]|nr:TolC family outer membrane protein [Magnetococcales bacterium]
MKNKFFVLVGLMVFSWSSQAYSQSLTEMISQSLANNPDVQAAQSNMQAVETQINQAKSGFLPVIDLNLGFGLEESDNTTTRSAAGDHRQTLRRGESGIQLTQPLFDGFKTKHDRARAEALYLAAKNSFEQASEIVASNTVSSYLEVVKRHELLELIKDNVVLHQRALDKIKRKAEVGGGNKVDVQQTESRLALNLSSHSLGLIGLKNSHSRFFRISGQKASELFRPVPDAALMPASLDEAIEAAMKNHPAIQAAEANLAAAKAEKEGARASLLPEVDLELGYDNNGNISGAEGHSHSLSAMVKLNYNLFRGGADKARGQELLNRVEQRLALLEQVRQDTREQIENSWETLTESQNRIRHLRNHVQISQVVTKSYNDQFKMGKRTFLDVLNSETELFNARTALITAELENLKSAYQILAHMGIMRRSLEGGQ